MEKIQLPKGTFDILPYGAEAPWQSSALWQFVEEICRKTAEAYGYQEIRTPIYERGELFDKGVGETSDIVTKEMFTFQDKGGRLMSLRPEGTSSVMRAFIEHHLAQLKPVHKFFYIGPMFRYERPQQGRYRQHHQFGVEAIGVSHPEQDAETIDLLFQIYQRLGLRHIKVHLNTVGDLPSRAAFRQALIDYLKPHFSQLSAESQIRFEKNPLRILDSKDPQDLELLQHAPSILHFLSAPAKDHFQKLCDLLSLIHIPYAINDKIVRGLDYYHQTVFECIAEDLGAQNTMGAGGRYDGLLATFGGPDLPGVGWATGLERVLQAMVAQNLSHPPRENLTVYFIPLGEAAKAKCFSLATLCRHHQIASDVELSAKKMQTALQNASRLEATCCVIIGEDELRTGCAQLKHLAKREQREVPFDHLIPAIQELQYV